MRFPSPNRKEKKHLGSVNYGRTEAVDWHPAGKGFHKGEDARVIDLLEHRLASGFQAGILLLMTYNQDGWNLYQDSERS